EFHRQQVEHRVLAGGIDLAALAAIDPLEAQRRAAAPKLGLLRTLARGPIEAVERHHEALFLRSPDNVGDLDEGILEMGGDDLEVVPVEGDEFHRLHGMRSCRPAALLGYEVIRKRPPVAQATPRQRRAAKTTRRQAARSCQPTAA